MYGTQGQVQLLGGLQGRNRGESKRVPVQVRPPPTGYLEDDDNLKKEGVKC